jgi:hypothetical protein
MIRKFITTNKTWLYLIIATSLLTILIEIFCVSHGISDFFPFFFLIPMFLVIYAFPKKGILFSVAMGWIYMILVYGFGSFPTRVIAVHTAWFYIYVSLGILLSSRVINYREKSEEFDEMKRRAFQQIEENMEQFEILSDQIRNPLQAIMLNSDTITMDAKAKEDIQRQVHIIEDILSRIDEKNIESEKIRKYLKKYCGFDPPE